MTSEGDLVLIHTREKPTLYARIEAIEPDVKKDWYHVTLLLLTIPTQIVTWILRWEYIDGEPFTMGGQPMMLKPVERVAICREPEDGDNTPESKGGRKPAKVFPLKKKS